MFGKIVNRLNKYPLFMGIESEALNDMLICMNPIMSIHKKNEFVSIAGEKLDKLGIIISGSVAVTKENSTGDRVIIAILNQGETLGEMAVFSGKKFWPATVVAQEDCEVMFIPPEKIVGQCEKSCFGHKLLILNMMKIISKKALLLNKKVEYLAIKSLRTRISRFFVEEYNDSGNLYFLMPMNRNEFADFLNVSRPSLSREMCKMRDEGIIEFHKSSIKIKNIEALLDYAK